MICILNSEGLIWNTLVELSDSDESEIMRLVVQETVENLKRWLISTGVLLQSFDSFGESLLVNESENLMQILPEEKKILEAIVNREEITKNKMEEFGFLFFKITWESDFYKFKMQESSHIPIEDSWINTESMCIFMGKNPPDGFSRFWQSFHIVGGVNCVPFTHEDLKTVIISFDRDNNLVDIVVTSFDSDEKVIEIEKSLYKKAPRVVVCRRLW